MAKLNDLTGKEWILFTKSWFKVTAKSRGKEEIKHPAKYPEELVSEFLRFFTKENDVVFDPFLGVGSTIVSAESLNRIGIGIEINEEFAQCAKNRCSENATILLGDSRKQIDKIKKESIDFIMTSPPYWNILSKKRGNSDSQHGDREKKGLKLTYSDLTDDLSNIEDYNIFLNELTKLFNKCYLKLKNNKYMVIVVQNFRNNDVVARIAGDEFAIICHGITLVDFNRIKKNIEKDCEKWTLENNAPFKLSISMGAQVYPSPDVGYDLEKLLSLADKTLYEVKKAKKAKVASKKA